MNFNLARMSAVCEALGHPERTFVAIHVAGTNGKGSVCALLSSAFRSCRLRTGLYTSPHLERLTERFQIDGREMSLAELARLSRRVANAFRSVRLRPTQFEYLTAIAFLFFSLHRVDVAVVEVGLGGRLDATNVLGHVAVSVITNIGLDHTEWLGRTPLAIAREKAGIIRANTPVATGAEKEALLAIRKVAAERNAPVRVIPSEVSRRTGLTPLFGPHQRRNAALARLVIGELRRLGWTLPQREVERGFQRARWPGRFERFTLRAGENRISLILDGAHNVPAAHALAESLREAHVKRVELLFGALKDKDVRGIAHVLAPRVSRVSTVRVNSSRAADAPSLARLSVWRDRARPFSSLKDAFADIARRGPEQPVLVTGSLYLVGAVRSLVNQRSIE